MAKMKLTNKNKQNLKDFLGKSTVIKKKHGSERPMIDAGIHTKDDKQQPEPALISIEERSKEDDLHVAITSDKKNSQEEKKRNLAEIAELWGRMNDEKDLTNVLNKALQVLYGKDAKAINTGWLKHIARKNLYHSFRIPKKKKGKYRNIDAPAKGLKNIQRALNLVFQQIYTPHAAAMGFVPNRSVVDNAQAHLGQRFVYNIDLKDFFPSISSGRLYKRLMSKPFCLNGTLASLISDLCCFKNKDGKKVLPQGAPTSPAITNFICERLDIKLTKLAKAYKLKYTRYADDITFSGMSNMFSPEGKFCTSLRNIIENEESFLINGEKTRVCHRGMRQEVTGLTVNSKTNVSRKYIKQLRTLIHSWEVKGYDEAQAIFVEHYKETNTRHLLSKGEHHIENIISGKLMYLKMVKGEMDNTYRALSLRFNELVEAQFGIKKAVPEMEKNNADRVILNELTNLTNLLEIGTYTSEKDDKQRGNTANS